MHFTVLFTFNDIETCKVKVRLKLGDFPDANVRRNWPKSKSLGASKIRVRPKLGVLR